MVHPAEPENMSNQGGIYLDDVLGTTRALGATGSPFRPVSNITEALELADEKNISTIYIFNFGTYTLPSDVWYIHFVGNARFGSGPRILLGGRDTSQCTFHGVQVDGTCTGYTTFIDCYVRSGCVIYGEFYNCAFATSLTCSGDNNWYNCTFGEQATANATTIAQADFNCLYFGCNGRLILGNSGGGESRIYGDGLDLTINNTNDGSTYYLYGDIALTNLETGVLTLHDRTLQSGYLAGHERILEVSITAAANAAVTTVATVTTQPCLIESIVIHADAAQTVDMTSCAIEGGVGQVVEFISAAVAVQASLDAADKQIYWVDAVRLAAGKLITIDLQGTGATAVDLTITIKYRACVDGGYLV